MKLAKSDPREKLVAFMWRKEYALRDLKGYKNGLYFNQKDARDIRKWHQCRAEEVWCKLTKRINENPSTAGVSAATCPFCLYSTGCGGCSYARRHGLCQSDRSDLFTIVNMKFRGEPLSLGIWDVFTNQWYLRILTEIGG